MAKNHSESYLSRLFSPENLPNIGLLVAGIFGIVIAICTLRAINRQAVTMDRTLRIDQRAWLGIINIQITTGMLALRDFIVNVTSKNTGKTPAKDVVFYVRMQALLEGEHPEYKYNNGKGSGLIFPDSENTTEIGRGHPLSQATVDDLNNGRRQLVLHGRIEYKDVFGTEHWTDWCYYLVGTELFTTHSEHNDTDDDKPN